MTTTGMTTDAPWSTGESHEDSGIKAKAGTVGQEAGSQASQVAGEAKAQAAGLASQAKAQLGSQVQEQHSKLTSSIRSAADELETLLNGEGNASGPITDLVRQLATQARTSADSLENSSPGELLEQFSAFARRKPGTFLVGAAIAGVLAGRLTRGAKEATSSDDEISTGYAQPAISSYATETGYPAADQATDEIYPGETYAGEGAGYSATSGDIYEETRGDVLSLPDATGDPLGGTRPIADRGL